MKQSIIFKTLLILGSVIVVIFMGSGYLFMQNDKELINDIRKYNLEKTMKALDERQDDRLESNQIYMKDTVSMIAKNSSEYLMNFDTEGLKKSLLFDIKKDGIMAIQIWDNETNEIFLLAFKQNNKVVFKNDLPNEFEKFIQLKSPINEISEINSGVIEKIGEVTLYYDKSIIINQIKLLKKTTKKEIEQFNHTVDKKLSSAIMVKFIINIISLFAILIIITILLRKFVNKPLKILQAGLNDFFSFLQNKKDNTNKIKINSNDEFGQMANSLNENISVSAKLHEEIYELNTNLEARIKEKTAKVTTLLDNAGQGFLTFDKNFSIDEEYSKECIKLIGSNIAKKNITELLFNNTSKKEFFISTLLNALEETVEIKRNAYLSLLPSIILLNKKAVRLEYKILENNHFMLILTNITSQKKLEKKIKKEQEILKMIVSIVSEPDTFYEIKDEYKEFINSYENLIDTTKTPLYNISSMYRSIHTFKGTFSQLYMQDIVNYLHNLESDISKMIQETVHSNSDLLELLNNSDFNSSLKKSLNIIKEILGEEFINSQNFLKIDFTDIKSLQDKISNILDHKASFTPECKDILFHVQNLSSQKLITLLQPYISLTRQLSTRLEKEIYEFDIVGDKNLVVTDKFKPFIKSLIHIFRNSIDHGIEIPEVRVDNGKDENGTILCSFKEENDNLYLTISDDGAGINIEKIKEKLLSKGIDADNLSDQKIYEFIFDDNFTTKDDISDLSGRGIGITAVKYELEKLNGEIKIISQKDTGTTFEFVVPL